MRRATVPKALQDQLGEDATEAFVYVLNAHRQQMTEDLLARFDARTDEIVRRLDSRMDRVEQRLDRLTEKQETCRVEMAEGFGTMRAEMAAQRADIMKWMFVFWVGQAFVVLAYFRAGQYLAGR